MWICEILIFGHDISYSKFTSANQISSKSNEQWQRHCDITIFEMAAIRHLEFSNLQSWSYDLCLHAKLNRMDNFIPQNFILITKYCLGYSQKKRFSRQRLSTIGGH